MGQERWASSDGPGALVQGHRARGQGYALPPTLPGELVFSRSSPSRASALWAGRYSTVTRIRHRVQARRFGVSAERRAGAQGPVRAVERWLEYPVGPARAGHRQCENAHLAQLRRKHESPLSFWADHGSVRIRGCAMSVHSYRSARSSRATFARVKEAWLQNAPGA